MNKDFKESLNSLEYLDREGCYESAGRSIRMLAALSEAIDECVPKTFVSAVVSRFEAMIGEYD